ncbi:sodium-dependent phosphate transport protein 2B [Elysia marginata]|uniref:Sodium-dependent phosphate transport protein 2B n=1 Tax=Elysia marginata TaxID=1093978 RepID=A0AAV4GXT3_9GAST|nr:sodium-dependent phosphate transport protein 2B [Elysia marginata]
MGCLSTPYDEEEPIVGSDSRISSIEHNEGEDDPWRLAAIEEDSTPWETLTLKLKCNRVALLTGKIACLLCLLWMFVCSLDCLSSAFRLLGGKVAGEALASSVLLSNPVAGVMIGVLATVLVQSSSTATSILVSMVTSEVLTLPHAIPIVMGSNIGTTVTNTLVALGQVRAKGDFRRAFAAATLHDFFNWLCVIVLLPVEVTSGYLYHFTDAITKGLDLNRTNSTTSNTKLLKAITEPVTKEIIDLSSAKIKAIARGEKVNGSIIELGDHLFSNWPGSDSSAGVLLLTASLVSLTACLLLIVKILCSLLRGAVAKAIQRVVNSDFPGPWRHLTGYAAMIVGAALTVLIQSSSVLTSALTPLVGLGAVHLERMYPVILGANLGTTMTGMLAALASDPESMRAGIRLALSHFLFNFSGILLWYPWPPSRKVPLSAAKAMGNTVARYPWFALAYILLAFLLLPLLVFAVSLSGPAGLAAVAAPVVALGILLAMVNFLQRHAVHMLPVRLRTWEDSGLPKALRSLEPYDSFFNKLCGGICREKFRSKSSEKEKLVKRQPKSKETEFNTDDPFSIDDD